MYHAISYVWGSPNDTVTILVNDKKMEVRRNCEYALKQSAWYGDAHYIWCDASFGEVIYGAIALQNELEETREKGEWMRNVRFVRLTGANHYVSSSNHFRISLSLH